VDVDDTLLASDVGTRVALALDLDGPAPHPHAVEAMHDLARTHAVVVLTARPATAAGGTVRWLDRRGFPRVPVLLAPGLLLTEDARRRHKTRALRALCACGHRIAWGIGDKRSDVEAYRAVGARTIASVDGSCDPDLPALGGADTILSVRDGWTHVPGRVRAPLGR
jgi:hypothetical protein